MTICSRTDLASEAHSFFSSRQESFPTGVGYAVRRETLEGLAVTAVDIEAPQAARTLQLPLGHYVTLHLPAPVSRRAPDYLDQVHALSLLIRRFLPRERSDGALIAALGNPDVTPDALGPLAAESVLVTRHLRDNPLFRSFLPTALCRTGVLGTTGMESAFQIQTLCRAVHPSCVLVVDALAGADTESLCRCVQVTDAGIAPGSGVGNDRAALCLETLGVPVVAVGVPTVVDAASLSGRAELGEMFVTPRYIDSEVRHLSRLIGYAINAALHPSLSLEEMEQLLE